jgi:hypothetical protein
MIYLDDPMLKHPPLRIDHFGEHLALPPSGALCVFG